MKNETLEACTRSLLPIRDALHILNGKWKLPIMFSLMFDDRRFSELEREIKGIRPKMLAKELKELEANYLVERKPTGKNNDITGKNNDIMEYTITPYGRTLKKLIVEIEIWGIKHREKIIGK